jgi:hypothetical protein
MTALIGTHAAAYNDVDADKYFGPYQAACDSRQPRLMEIALDGLHSLIGIYKIDNTYLYSHLILSHPTISEHGYMRGKKKLTSSTSTGLNEESEDKPSGRRTLMDLIIETINKCSEDFDEGVQVQVRYVEVSVILSAFNIVTLSE